MTHCATCTGWARNVNIADANPNAIDPCHGIDCESAIAEAVARDQAEIAELKDQIAKRSHVRVTCHDVWIRERERRQKAEAERDALRADLKREKQSHLEDCLKLTYMRDAMEADLTAVVEALRLTHCCATIREDGTCLGCTVSYALARPGIQAILEDK